MKVTMKQYKAVREKLEAVRKDLNILMVRGATV